MEHANVETDRPTRGCVESLGKCMIDGACGLAGGLIGVRILHTVGIDVNLAFAIPSGVITAFIGYRRM